MSLLSKMLELSDANVELYKAGTPQTWPLHLWDTPDYKGCRLEVHTSDHVTYHVWVIVAEENYAFALQEKFENTLRDGEKLRKQFDTFFERRRLSLWWYQGGSEFVGAIADMVSRSLR